MSLANASQIAIQEAFQRLRQNEFPNNVWLNTNNKYGKDTLNILKSDLSNNTLNSSDLSEYVATSSVLHCFDGWEFLSQAVGALLEGDTGTAIHLGYYAELRAGMSLLASEGIGIFNFANMIFDQSRQALLLNKDGTHTAVWKVFEQWANDNKSVRLLDVLKVRGVSLSDWLIAAGYSRQSGTSSELAKEWLLNWSLDIQEPKKDRDLRGEVSYRPQWLHPNHYKMNDLPDVFLKLKSFWEVCEPVDGGSLESLDPFLLREALATAYRATFTSNFTSKTSKSYEQFIEEVLGNLGMDTGGTLNTFLCDRAASKHVLFEEAARPGQDPNTNQMQPLSVIARALLLLRVASATSANLLSTSGITSQDINFWWGDIGTYFGLWEPGHEPDPTADLWQDVELTLEAINQWCQANVGLGNPTPDTKRQLLPDLYQLKQFQRVGLWTLDL